MFDISLASDHNKIINSVSYRKFRINIGNFEEFFLSPLCYWTVEDYQLHWRNKLNAFVKSQKEKTFLITEIYEPTKANFIRWWVLYREDADIYFQESVLFTSELEGCFSINDAESYISQRETINEDGDKISEWSLSMSQLKLSPLLN